MISSCQERNSGNGFLKKYRTLSWRRNDWGIPAIAVLLMDVAWGGCVRFCLEDVVNIPMVMIPPRRFVV